MEFIYHRDYLEEIFALLKPPGSRLELVASLLVIYFLSPNSTPRRAAYRTLGTDSLTSSTVHTRPTCSTRFRTGLYRGSLIRSTRASARIGTASRKICFWRRVVHWHTSPTYGRPYSCAEGEALTALDTSRSLSRIEYINNHLNLVIKNLTLEGTNLSPNIVSMDRHNYVEFSPYDSVPGAWLQIHFLPNASGHA